MYTYLSSVWANGRKEKRMSVLFGAYSPSCTMHAQVAAIMLRWDSITPYE